MKVFEEDMRQLQTCLPLFGHLMFAIQHYKYAVLLLHIGGYALIRTPPGDGDS